MDYIERRKQSFLLRLPKSVREQAAQIAADEGISLNQFIAIALAEKLSRMEAEGEYEARTSKENLRPQNHLRVIR